MSFLSFPSAALPALICAAGSFYLFKLRFFFFAHPLKTVRGVSGGGGMRAMSLSLAGTLGVGNIVGVAVAISLGGAGAVFWMWVSALVAAVLKYAETVLAVRYREERAGAFRGGPMYYMKNGIGGRTGRALAAIFACVAAALSFVLGNLVQGRAAVDALRSVCDVPPAVIGAALAALCAASVFGGYGAVNWLCALAMALLCTIGGHTVFSWSLRYFPAAHVSTIKLLDPLFSTLLGLLFLGELPTFVTLLGCVVLIGGTALYIRSGN